MQEAQKRQEKVALSTTAPHEVLGTVMHVLLSASDGTNELMEMESAKGY